MINAMKVTILYITKINIITLSLRNRCERIVKNTKAIIVLLNKVTSMTVSEDY